MTVWLAVQEVKHEGDSYLGVYASLEMAMARTSTEMWFKNSDGSWETKATERQSWYVIHPMEVIE
jgi:hypothetical protein